MPFIRVKSPAFPAEICRLSDMSTTLTAVHDGAREVGVVRRGLGGGGDGDEVGECVAGLGVAGLGEDGDAGHDEVDHEEGKLSGDRWMQARA